MSITAQVIPQLVKYTMVPSSLSAMDSQTLSKDMEKNPNLQGKLE
jgi:hypothetical protein